MNVKTLFSLLAVAVALTSCGEWPCWHNHPIGPPPAHQHHGYVYENDAVTPPCKPAPAPAPCAAQQ